MRPKETYDSGPDSDDLHNERGEERELPEGGSPFDGDADHDVVRLLHGVQAGQDQVHRGNDCVRAGMRPLCNEIFTFYFLSNHCKFL